MCVCRSGVCAVCERKLVTAVLLFCVPGILFSGVILEGDLWAQRWRDFWILFCGARFFDYFYVAFDKSIFANHFIMLYLLYFQKRGADAEGSDYLQNVDRQPNNAKDQKWRID